MAIGPIAGKFGSPLYCAYRAATVAGVLGLFGVAALFAQTPNDAAVPPARLAASQAPKQVAHPVHHRKKTEAVAPETPPVEVRPPDPPPPDWPALAQANPAEVHFNGSTLTVVAQNASLQQILREITTATGVKVDGFSTDQRIFGSYGPAPAREVIGQLLDGTGYNVLIIGDLGQGTPRQLVLTFRNGGAGAPVAGIPQTNANGEEEPVEEPEVQEQPEQAPPPRPFRNPPPGRNPQQMLQEMQQRQLQYQQNQQNPQQNPQPNPN